MNRRLLLAAFFLLCVYALAYWYRGNINGAQDTNVYRSIAEKVQMTHRGQPTEISSEYPPLATTVFYAVAEAGTVTGMGFTYAWIAFLLLCAVAGTAYLWSIPGERPWVFLLPCALAVSVVLLSQELLFARYDILVGILLFLCWRAHAHGKFRTGLVFLLLAAAIKALPLLLIPVYLLHTPRKAALPQLATGILTATAVIVLCMGALTAKGFFFNLQYFETYHTDRGIQAESTWSGLQMLTDVAQGRKSELAFGHLSVNNMRLGGATRSFSTILLIGGVAGLAYAGWRSYRRGQTALAPYFIGTMLWVLAVSPILSPQYLVWVVPLLVAYGVQLCRGREQLDTLTVAFLVLLGTLTLCTQWIYPHHYGQFMNEQYPYLVVMLNLRNLSLLGLLGSLLLLPAPRDARVP